MFWRSLSPQCLRTGRIETTKAAKTKIWILLVLLSSVAGLVVAQVPGTPPEEAFPKPPYSPYANRNYPTQSFFGDQHLHTGFSMDAGAFGARLNPEDAYRFARGEQITSNTGQPLKLSRPLDCWQ